MPRPSSSYVSTASLQTHTMATGARSPPWTPPGSGELSREGSLAFSSGLPHPHSAVPRRAEAYFSILKEWRRPQALRQQPALPVTGRDPRFRTSLSIECCYTTLYTQRTVSVAPGSDDLLETVR